MNKLSTKFAIDFMKNKGSKTRKTFQIYESFIDKKTKIINKYFSFK